MNKIKHFLEKNSVYILILISFITFIYTVIRNYGLYPSVVDELVYVNNAYINGLKNAQVPDYLHRIIFANTKFCHNGWLDCARLLNSIFFISALPLIYLISRRYTGVIVSLILVTIIAFGTVSSYTAYFMPEPLYWYFFWLLTWYVTKIQYLKTSNIIVASILLFILYSIKPHASFLIPSLIIYFSYLGISRNEKIINIIKFNLKFIILIIIYKLLTQLLIDGSINLKIFGNTYSSVGDSIYIKLLNKENLFIFINAIKVVSLSNIIGIICIFCIPIILIIYYFVSSNTNNLIIKKDFVIYTTLVVFPLILVSIIFTAGFTLNNPPEILRVHTRYYGFSLPLLLISAAIISEIDFKKNNIITFIIIAPIIISILFLMNGVLDKYTINAVDGPEIRGLVGSVKGMNILGSIGIGLCILFLINRRLAFIFYLMIFQVSFLLISNIVVNKELRNRLYSTPYDRAALFAKEYLPIGLRSRLLLLGQPDALGILSLSQIYLRNKDAKIKVAQEGDILRSDELPHDINWIAYSGTYGFNFNTKEIFKGEGFDLIYIPRYYPMKFSEERWPGMIQSTSGLGVAEPWGRWTIAKNVEIRFTDDLPRKFILTINGSPYGSNVNKDIIVRVGNESKKFQFHPNENKVAISFDLHKQSKVITFEIPEPKSLPNGGPALGVGLTELNITPD